LYVKSFVLFITFGDDKANFQEFNNDQKGHKITYY